MTTSAINDASSISESDLRTGHIALVYQPIVDSRAEEPVFFEALARIVLQDGRVVAAGTFMESIRHTELGRELDLRVLRRFKRDLDEIPWLKASLNVPINSIANRSWYSAFEEIVKTGGDFYDRLLVEIDEMSAMTLPELAADFMKEFQPYGVLFALDNFGKERTSLKNLVNFHFDFLKVDQYFVRGIAQSADKQVIMRAIVGIAQELDVECVAEKVETHDEAKCLRGLGISLMEGHLFGQPLYASTLKVVFSPQSASGIGLSKTKSTPL